MLGPPPGTRVFVACGVTDMRKGFDGLAALVLTVSVQDPYSGAMFCFRGRRGDLLKILVWDGQGLILVAKRLEKGRFVWRQARDGAILLEQPDEWVTQRCRYMTLETVAVVSDTGQVRLGAVPT